MIQWTHVIGAIRLDTVATTTAEAMFLTQTAVRNLPRVTGSERDLTYHISMPPGHNHSSNCDEFNRKSNLYDDCKHQMFTNQTITCLTLDADLKDRTFHETLRELTHMLARLSSWLFIERCVVSVSDDYGHSFVFNNPEWLWRNTEYTFRGRICRNLMAPWLDTINNEESK